MKTVHGWEDSHARALCRAGWRLFGNCDIPDLALFQQHYATLDSMRWAAGHELKLLRVGTRILGALVGLGVIGSLRGDPTGPCSVFPSSSTVSLWTQWFPHDPHRHRS